MASLSVRNNYLVASKGLYVDCYNFATHSIIDVSSSVAQQDNDTITSLEISADGKYLALITSSSKQLLIYDLPSSKEVLSYVLSRSASKLRFTEDSKHILIADKTGDAVIYDLQCTGSGTKLLGHLSLLLDVLQTKNEKYIITSDRDEKIRVSCYPNTYNIQSYCLGHKEFVNHLEILPHNDRYLISTSGDGTIKAWNYEVGNYCHNIDTFRDINDTQLKDNFSKAMDEEGVEVDALPIVHLAVFSVNDTCSILAVAVHTFKELLIYSLQNASQPFTHKLECKLPLEKLPTAIKLHNACLYVYNDEEAVVVIYNVIQNEQGFHLELREKIHLFENIVFKPDTKSGDHDCIKVLYKRKFDNVQEYQERKRQRLEKSLQ